MSFSSLRSNLSLYKLASAACCTCCTFWFLTAIVLASTLGTLGFANNNNRDCSTPFSLPPSPSTPPPPLPHPNDIGEELNELIDSSGVYVVVHDPYWGKSLLTAPDAYSTSCTTNLDCRSNNCVSGICATSPPKCSSSENNSDVLWWCPSKDARQRGSFSASFLQTKTNAPSRPVVYHFPGVMNGIAFNVTNEYAALCYYPRDSGTSDRAQYCGCGNNTYWPKGVTQTCNERNSYAQWNSTNATQFFDDFSNPPPPRNLGNNSLTLEAFSVISPLIHFPTGIQADNWNEVIIRAWLEMPMKNAPIVSFFYIVGTNFDGEEYERKAVEVQTAFKSWTNVTIPISSYNITSRRFASVPRRQKHLDRRAMAVSTE